MSEEEKYLSPDPGLPRYRELYEVLRSHILTGVYREGDLLPSENELCTVYGLTRPTVRHALDELVREGLIKKQKGKGSIVHALPTGIGILSVAGTTSALGDRNLETKIIRGPEVRKWEEGFFFPLPDPYIESGCIYMERLRLVNGSPLFYDISYLPNINLPRFTSRSFENKSLFDTLRRHYRIEVTGGEQRLWAIPATPEIAGYLQMKPGEPVLHLERKIDTNRVGYSFFSSLYCNTKDYALSGQF